MTRFGFDFRDAVIHYQTSGGWLSLSAKNATFFLQCSGNVAMSPKGSTPQVTVSCSPAVAASTHWTTEVPTPRARPILSITQAAGRRMCVSTDDLAGRGPTRKRRRKNRRPGGGYCCCSSGNQLLASGPAIAILLFLAMQAGAQSVSQPPTPTGRASAGDGGKCIKLALVLIPPTEAALLFRL